MNDDKQVNRLRDRLKTIRAQTGIDMTILLRKYFIDGFLSLLSTSDYQTRFIWKGGFVLSAITGVRERTTVDLDTMIQGISVETANLEQLVNKIITSRNYYGVRYYLLDIQNIQETKEYSGKRIRLQARLGQIKDSFHLDVATGEKLIPDEIQYSYTPLLGTEKINLLIYRPERILVEKLQTVITRGAFNTRMKDFYDIYILTKMEEINLSILKVAWSNLLSERQFQSDFEQWSEILSAIKDNKSMETFWLHYRREHKFATGIDFSETIIMVEQWLTELSYL
ncbi:nucleotidyl transferase AbiEii/AbiGii toxin family protein [Lentilactobacillus raoultii]|uniref:Nucleotidyl transferase AbiEii/AbiGii toxin family protein n=1 Tax=Lentilactobacillus raoultii TaxID=1987503 RepID=A0ABW3PJS3_9LACO|nr:nucleotidyl transferase AbiEii/AbiGii toxin family protein [Lentilactobacillus raoultii]